MPDTPRIHQETETRTLSLGFSSETHPAKTRVSLVCGRWESHALSRTPLMRTPGPRRMVLLPLRDMMHTGPPQTRPRPRPGTVSSSCLQPGEAQLYNATHPCAQTPRWPVPDSKAYSSLQGQENGGTVVLRGATQSFDKCSQTVCAAQKHRRHDANQTQPVSLRS